MANGELNLNLNFKLNEEATINIFYKKNNIKSIRYRDDNTDFTVSVKWENMKEIFSQPKTNLLNTFENFLASLGEYNCQILSSMSVVSTSDTGDKNEYLKNNFLRGLSSIIVLIKLNRMGKYFNREIEGPISINSMKLLRMMIHFHVNYNQDNSLLLQYCLDFINRWSKILQTGDKVDKYNFLSLLITDYIKLTPKQINQSDIEKRVQTMEKMLGITSL